ncbi:MAG: ABC transporter substrate-binding protein [Clostridiales bacterium]|jgi:putative aldouronate transport system substrate-binding protein|nr:ABC transporter substrate-binding protein [Clostridiales bacterium]MDR2750122.1 ABC transporter substrate-binding protein [Clostridiales bacterium]
MKRIISALLAAVLAFSLAACGSGSQPTANQEPATAASQAPAAAKTAAPAADPAPAAEPAQTGGLPVLSPSNPVTLTTWITSNYAAPSNDNKLTKLLKDKLGVTISYEIITPDNADQKIGVMLAGGDYPDLVGAVELNARFITGGALIPLDDYLKPDVADVLYTHVEPYWNRLSFDAGDGAKHIYVLPNYNRYYGEITGGTNYSASGFWIQKDVLADAGYPDIENMTLDKYFKLIKDYMAKYPTIEGQPTIGFEILAANGREWGLTNPPEYLAGAPNNGGVIVDSNNVAAIFADKEISKTYYQYLNQMNAEGVVDQETFTQTLDQYLAKLASGRVLGMYDQRWNFGNAYDSLHSAGKDERTYVSLLPVYDGYKPYYADREVMNINQGFGVSVSCQQPDVAVAFLNTLLSEEWQKLLSWGIEGEDYSVGADGLFTRSEAQRNNAKDLVWRASNRLEALLDILPKHQGTYSDGNAYSADDQPTEFFATLVDYDKDFLTKYNKKTWRDFLNQPPDNPVYYPAWNIALPDGSEAQMANTQLTDTSLQFLPKAILAAPSEFESIWSDYVAQIGKINIKAYEDAVNAGIQERIANWG